MWNVTERGQARKGRRTLPRHPGCGHAAAKPHRTRAHRLCDAPSETGPREVGDPLPGLTEAQRGSFLLGQALFTRVTSPDEGLGPIAYDALDMEARAYLIRFLVSL